MALGALLGPDAAADAYTWVATELAAAAGTDGTGSVETLPDHGASSGVPAGAALTVQEQRAASDLAAADAALGQPEPVGDAPHVGVGSVDAGGAGAALAAGGGLLCPVAGPNSFIDSFGAPRSGGRTHQGTDLMADRGTPAVAVAAGVVVQVNPTDTPGSLGGITVSYTTANGDRWYNAHLTTLAAGIRVGQYLRAGQTFGYVGTTGDARYTPPHLHIELHPGGADQAIDAYALLRRACG